MACTKKQYPILEYLLTSKDLKEHIDINTNNNFFLRHVMHCQDLDFIKFFISLEKHHTFKKNAYISKQLNEIFKLSVSYAQEYNDYNIVEYLVFDYKIKEKPLRGFLNERDNDYIKKMFTMRKLHEKLEKDIDVKNPSLISKPSHKL